MFKLRQLFLQEQGEGSDLGGSEASSKSDEQPDVNKLLEQVNSLSEEKARMKNKLDELLNETKKNKEQRRQAELEMQRISEEKAKQQGDYEQLYKSQTEKAQTLEQQLSELRNQVNNEKKQTAVMRIASELADGVDAENLAYLIQNRLKITDEGLKVLDNDGNLTVSSVDDFKKEIQTTERFKSLLRGVSASGGGATGNNNASVTTKVVSRDEFNKMSNSQRVKFFNDGGRIG